MSEKIKFKSKDRDENYEPTSSEDEYSEGEKELLKNVRKTKDSDSDEEEEVYGFSGSDSESEKGDLADSDIEGKEESGDDLPDVRAWGKKKRDFYNTDYVDEDYGGFGKDEEAAKIEEQEARDLQKRLTEQLNDEDFSFDFFSAKKTDDKPDNDTEIIKTDLSAMSQRQKLQLLKKESPEFSGLVSDFKEKLAVANDELKPIIDLCRAKKLPDCSAIQFIETFYEVVLNYCTNISFYLLLKAKKTTIANHPVTKRLLQFRQIIKQIEPVYETSIKSQVKDIMLALANDVDVHLSKNGTDSNKSKSGNDGSEDNESDDQMDVGDEIIPTKMDIESKLTTPLFENDDGTDKRAITYQMAKNKGLTPRRKKEQRNPRVKHRNKFRKAKIRRKGAVREPRTETTRYAGEMSGIKSNVKKSIKIKY